MAARWTVCVETPYLTARSMRMPKPVGGSYVFEEMVVLDDLG